MEAAVWALAGVVVILVVLVMALTLRRSGTAAADLKQASEQLLLLAEQRFKQAAHAQNAELDSKKQLIDQQVQAVKTELEKVTALVGGIEKDRQAKFSELATHIKTLGEQATGLTAATSTLREALASPRTRGQWGERIADDILRFAGFIEGVDYQKQATLEGSGSRPDFVILLPKGLRLNMDCKFPLDNYLKALDTPGDTERENCERAFARDVRARVKEITGREYIDPEGGTVDCVLLLIPNESIYSYVHQADPQLLDYAVQNRVVCCSPLTLFAVLAVIRQAVDNFAIHEKSDEVLRQLGRFKAEWGKFEEALGTVGERLASTQKAYEQVVGPRKRQLERPLAELENLRQRKGLEIAPADDDQSFSLPQTG
ncbi:MAG: DNA recombination protein RmuC [Dehalococcoidia bacterium]|jgi:DNA recombination protein RmuC|nr:MAG: DNA recombination protein RmuC [Dehalococcoidia bacterium]